MVSSTPPEAGDARAPEPTTLQMPPAIEVDLATHADRPPAPGRTDPGLGVGRSIGRYVVLDEVAQGGMGVVVLAHDPELGRNVALKMLRASGLRGDPEARARLVREAQAMARLRHPNVVTVFDVGEHGGRVYLAMEYVGGGTLRAWAAAKRKAPEGWAEIVAAYAQAGRGLAAAHDQGLVHRDFKPDNVLVEGERIQVTDFGIVSVAGATSIDDESLPQSDARLTSAGVVMGTVPYMAPQQHEGRDADARSDQFSFCVALYEALYGVRPFGGTDRDAVRSAVLAGEVPPAPPDSGVPRWVDAAIRRGLSRDPSTRWPSMDALLRVLEAPEEVDVGRRARVAFGVTAGVVFMLVPLASRRFGVPFDLTTYRGIVAQSAVLTCSSARGSGSDARRSCRRPSTAVPCSRCCVPWRCRYPSRSATPRRASPPPSRRSFSSSCRAP